MSQPPESGAPATKPRRTFIPRVPRKKEVKPDPEEEEQAINAEKEREILQRYHLREQVLKEKSKYEKKETPVEVSFGVAGQALPSKTYR